MAHAPIQVDDLTEFPSRLRSDLLRVALRDRWDRALMALGWLHLAFFATNQWAAMALNEKWPHMVLWPGEVVAVVVLLRGMIGRGWWRSTPLAGLLMRVWITFLIIDFNAVSLNVLTGIDEFKWYFLAWAGLSSFGFAVTAWLCGAWFLVPAFVMYFVGLAMVRWIGWSFLMHGVAWCAILQGIGLWLRRERLRREADEAESAFEG